MNSTAEMRLGDPAAKLGLVSRHDDDEDVPTLQFELPQVPLWTENSELVVVSGASPGAAEAVRNLRAQLTLQWMRVREPQLLSVVSVSRGEGRSFIAANLAVAFAQLRERTLLIDLDLRNSRQHHIFRVANGQGLGSYVSGAGGGQEIQRIEGFDALHLLTSGPRPAHPQELLAPRSMAPLLEHARASYDVVIVDTPAWACGSDARVISALAGQAMLVSAPGEATRDQTAQVIGDLRQVGVTVVGAVVNRR